MLAFATFTQQYLPNTCDKPGTVLGSGETVVSNLARPCSIGLWITIWIGIFIAPILQVRKPSPGQAKVLRPHNRKAEELVFKTRWSALWTTVLYCLSNSQPQDPEAWNSALNLSRKLGNNFKTGVSSFIKTTSGRHDYLALIKLGPCCGIAFYIHHKANKLIN